MAPRRPDRTARSGAPNKTPVSIPVAWNSLRRMMLTTLHRHFLDRLGDTEEQRG